MNVNEILTHVDHTLLLQTAVWEEIRKTCDEAVSYKTASVCIPPAYVRQASEYLEGKVPVCTVIGFPNGYTTTRTKAFETEDAIADGASEIDMVINIGWLKDGRYDLIRDEIRLLKTICGEKILKVIIETCLLTEEEKVKMCRIVTEAGADYIFAQNVGPNVKIKAAGGINSLEDAEKFLALGADRLGTSRIVRLVEGGTRADG